MREKSIVRIERIGAEPKADYSWASIKKEVKNFSPIRDEEHPISVQKIAGFNPGDFGLPSGEWHVSLEDAKIIGQTMTDHL